MANITILQGRIGKDPDVREVGDTLKARFSIATEEHWTKDGERKKHTDWHNVEAWGKDAEFIRDHVKVGSEVFVQGKLQTDKYEKRDGSSGYDTRVVIRPGAGKFDLIADPRPKQQGEEHPQGNQNRTTASRTNGAGAPRYDR